MHARPAPHDVAAVHRQVPPRHALPLEQPVLAPLQVAAQSPEGLSQAAGEQIAGLFTQLGKHAPVPSVSPWQR